MTAIEVTGSAPRWRAVAGERTVGSVRAVVRPDRRCFVFFEGRRDDAYGALLAAASAEFGGDLYTAVDEPDESELRRLTDLGFTVRRHEHLFRIATDTAPTRVAPPTGVDLVSAANVDLDRLRELDDTLRQDIPGADGWRWDADGFRQEISGPDFDPALYLVAVDRRSGSYLGLIRVWLNPSGPRLGCLAVLPAARRTRVTAALVATVAAELRARGMAEVVTDIAADNRAALGLLARRAATRTGGTYELIRPAAVSRAAG